MESLKAELQNIHLPILAGLLKSRGMISLARQESESRMLLFTRLPAKILSSKHLFTVFTTSVRTISTNSQPKNLRRSYLYVPASSDRMLEKSITSGSDVIIYDLEDSVSPLNSGKANARRRLKKFLVVCIYFHRHIQM